MIYRPDTQLSNSVENACIMTSPSIQHTRSASDDSMEKVSGPELEPPPSRPRYDSIVPTNHQHHESTSTSASESADSSPTTSLSVDSSTTEMSPGPSPESPMTKNSIPAPISVTVADKPRAGPAVAPFFEMQRPQTPGRRPKNLKNLAVNTAGASAVGRPAATAGNATFSTPGTAGLKAAWSNPGPSFNKPPSPPKRRQSNLALTIATAPNDGTRASPPRPIQLNVPPTPSFSRPQLRHFQSSPSLPLHTLPKLSQSTSVPMLQPSPVVERAEPTAADEHDEQTFMIPQSQEEKPAAYPDGPICVYEPYLDLYYEPTADQARLYDVILNVASEVRNPFDLAIGPSEPQPQVRLDGGGGIQYAPKRGSIAEQGDKGALSPVQESSSPTTPKATPLKDDFPLDLKELEKMPEYIHIPWEHNTDIVPDLLRLVKLIDDRIRTHKRVLVHCQCGVSRSATLIVAYCLFKHPEMGVQDAYDTIKKRSKWIGPNMNLIMQLQEFRSSLTAKARQMTTFKSLTPVETSTSWDEWKRPRLNTRVGPDTDMPKTAPLLEVGSRDVDIPPQCLPQAISSGPSSAPSGIAWPDDKSSDSPVLGRSSVPTVPYMRGSVPLEAADLPAIEIASAGTPKRSKEEGDKPDGQSPGLPLIPMQPPESVAPEDTFGLMSPSTTTEFPHSPLDRVALLGALGLNGQDQSKKQDSESSIQRVRSLRGPPMKKMLSIDSQALRKPRSMQHLQLQPSGSFKLQPDDEEALMSPRAQAFVGDPFAAQMTPDSGLADRRGSEASEVSNEDDPRSPALKGMSPITRSIADVLLR